MLATMTKDVNDVTLKT